MSTADCEWNKHKLELKPHAPKNKNRPQSSKIIILRSKLFMLIIMKFFQYLNESGHPKVNIAANEARY
jgi:hypothetical protein